MKPVACKNAAGGSTALQPAQRSSVPPFAALLRLEPLTDIAMRQRSVAIELGTGRCARCAAPSARVRQAGGGCRRLPLRGGRQLFHLLNYSSDILKRF
jgi:hypothetical protein